MREYGSEHPLQVLPDGYLENFSRFGHTIWLRSGREGLYYIALEIKTKVSPIILFPSYCCWSMSAPFSKAGWQIIYYRLNSDLTVDVDYLEYLLKAYQPGAVLTMNFYGSADTSEAISIIKKISPASICIEDFSHCTFSFEKIYNNNVDFYVTSVRKSIGITDGAIVISKFDLDSGFIVCDTTLFTMNRKIAQQSKLHYFFSNSEVEKKDYLSLLRTEEHRLDEFSSVYSVSDIGRLMMSAVNGQEIRYARSTNMHHAIELLKGKIKMIPGIEKSIDGAPFSLPILVEERDNVQQKLARRGVYAPVLWPLCNDARSVCRTSAYISDHILSLPIDQRYSYNDIEDMASIVLEICI